VPGDPSIYLIDPLPLTRAATGLLIQSVLPKAHLTSFGSVTAFLGETRKLDPSTIVFSLYDPDIAGLAAIASLTRNNRHRLIVLSPFQNQERIHTAFELGAYGYVPTSSQPATLRHAIELVMLGERYTPTLLPNARQSHAAPTDLSVKDFTRRQLQVLIALSAGKQTRKIAEDLHLAENTVKVHIRAVLRILKATNRTQAAMRAAELLANNQITLYPIRNKRRT
jgi:two-component system, NarL family, nitrate/nitrite response regulator NarL